MTRATPPASPAALGASRPLAPLARRCAALAYESLVLAAIVLLAGFLTAPFVAPADSGEAAIRVPAPGARALSAAIAFVVVGAYCTWSWSGGRRTLPMKAWRLDLARVDGRPVDAATAAIRYLAAWIGPAAALVAYVALRPGGFGAHAAWLVALNFLWALVDPERQFLHDRIARTRIVLVPARPSEGY